MEYGAMMIAATTLAGGVTATAWSISKLVSWRSCNAGDLAAAVLLLAVAVVMVLFGIASIIEAM